MTKRGWVALGSCALVVLEGCMPVGTSASAPQPSTAYSAAASSSHDTPLTVATFGDRVVATAATVTTGSFTLVITTGTIAGDLTLTYAGSYDVADPTTPRCRLDGTQNGQQLTLIAVGDDLYTKAGTGKYAKGSVSAAVAKLGLAAVRPDLPTLVGLVGSSVESVTYVGPTSVSGHSVDHWQAVVAASALAPDASGTTLVDLWIDPSDIVRQITYRLTSPVASTTSVTITYDGFNRPVSIPTPDPSELG